MYTHHVLEDELRLPISDSGCGPRHRDRRAKRSAAKHAADDSQGQTRTVNRSNEIFNANHTHSHFEVCSFCGAARDRLCDNHSYSHVLF